LCFTLFLKLPQQKILCLLRSVKDSLRYCFFIARITPSSYAGWMDISPISEKTTPSIWSQGELPPGPPMPMDSSWVKSMQRFFPRENPELLAKYASHLLSNMMRMLSNQINRDTKKAKETAQRMRDAIFGR
jgi:hypothetical protein